MKYVPYKKTSEEVLFLIGDGIDVDLSKVHVSADGVYGKYPSNGKSELITEEEWNNFIIEYEKLSKQ